jgi:hypothetical protein
MATKDTPYIETIGGRLILLSAAVALASLGAVALAGPGDHVMIVASAVPPFLIVMCLYGVGATIATHPLQAAAMLITLPIVGGPYLVLLTHAADAGTGLAIALLALTVFPAYWGSRPARKKAKAEPAAAVSGHP